MDGFGASDNEVDDVDDGPLENETLGMEIARRWSQAMLPDIPGGGNPPYLPLGNLQQCDLCRHLSAAWLE